MTTALGLAAVTAVLKDLLNNGLIDHDAMSHVGPVSVTSRSPDRIPVAEGQEVSQLNLFLYQVTPNPGWRNQGLPSADRNGARVSNPPLALDLHYLLTAYASDELHAEILLGYAMQLLHETPVLTRDAVRVSLAAPLAVPGGSSLPPALQALATSELADQVELVKLGPLPVSIDEMSKLWTAMSAHYRPSAAYLASVVLIDGRRSTRSALPVRGRGLYGVPFRLPEIEDVRAQAGAESPIVDQATVVLVGRRLLSDLTEVEVGGVRTLPAQVTDSQVVVRLPPGLPAGVHSLQVVQPALLGTPPAAHRGVESNAAAFVLRPTISAAVSDVQVSTVGGITVHAATVTVSFTPPVGRAQRVVLLLNGIPASADAGTHAYSVPVPPRSDTGPEEAASLPIQVSGVVPGPYLVRVQVDGAESPLETGPEGHYSAPHVTI